MQKSAKGKKTTQLSQSPQKGEVSLSRTRTQTMKVSDQSSKIGTKSSFAPNKLNKTKQQVKPVTIQQQKPAQITKKAIKIQDKNVQKSQQLQKQQQFQVKPVSPISKIKSNVTGNKKVVQPIRPSKLNLSSTKKQDTKQLINSKEQQEENNNIEIEDDQNNQQQLDDDINELSFENNQNEQNIKKQQNEQNLDNENTNNKQNQQQYQQQQSDQLIKTNSSYQNSIQNKQNQNIKRPILEEQNEDSEQQIQQNNFNQIIKENQNYNNENNNKQQIKQNSFNFSQDNFNFSPNINKPSIYASFQLESQTEQNDEINQNNISEQQKIQQKESINQIEVKQENQTENIQLQQQNFNINNNLNINNINKSNITSQSAQNNNNFLMNSNISSNNNNNNFLQFSQNKNEKQKFIQQLQFEFSDTSDDEETTNIQSKKIKKSSTLIFFQKKRKNKNSINSQESNEETLKNASLVITAKNTDDKYPEIIKNQNSWEKKPFSFYRQKNRCLTLEPLNSISIGKDNKLQNLLNVKGGNSNGQPIEFGQTIVEYENNLLPPNVVKKKISCNCKKTKCLKLYCDCFAQGEYCKDCNCTDCHNKPENEEERQDAMTQLEQRNPSAFKPKFQAQEDQEEEQEQIINNKGCNCKKSGCQKKYCECYNTGVKCTDLCKCEQCKNRDSNYLLEANNQNNNLKHACEKHEFVDDINLQQQQFEQMSQFGSILGGDKQFTKFPNSQNDFKEDNQNPIHSIQFLQNTMNPIMNNSQINSFLNYPNIQSSQEQNSQYQQGKNNGFFANYFQNQNSNTSNKESNRKKSNKTKKSQQQQQQKQQFSSFNQPNSLGLLNQYNQINENSNNNQNILDENSNRSTSKGFQQLTTKQQQKKTGIIIEKEDQ